MEQTIEVRKLDGLGIVLDFGPVDIDVANWLVNELINNLPMPETEA